MGEVTDAKLDVPWTRGPWSVGEDDSLSGCGFIPVVDARGATVAEVQPDYTENGGRLGEKDRARARLIAAAPQLAEALRFIVEQMELPGVQDHTISAYRHGAGFARARSALLAAGATP